ncbi:MAG: hypothetical protein H7123_08905 [Thermoleophilia bacterium]|nr:hypothetical protein [Thermoleophilia bacterium]
MRHPASLVLVCLLCAFALALSACSTRVADTQSPGTLSTTPEGHVPLTPAHVVTPDGPAVLATITPFAPTALSGQADWQIITAHISRSWRITWRVPLDWQITGGKRAESGDQRAETSAAFTTLHTGDVTLTAYLTELANDIPIQTYVSKNGYTFYVLERRVSVAPTDPDAASAYFHTAVVNIGGHIAKLEITYASADRFRFEDLANAVLATAEVTPA